MPTDCIAFRETGYFSEFISDYLEEKETVRPFYNRYPDLGNFKAQIEEKKLSYQEPSRHILVEALKNQYKNTNTSEVTLQHIASLKDKNTFTITTGHQLNLFTGPLYFLYKIISTINLTKKLKETYPDHNFVPVYWMATEDHDFDEINHFNFKGKKFQWNRPSTGAVGELSTEGLEEVFHLFNQELGVGKDADRLRGLFTNSYLKHNNLAAATRYLANELFGSYGLVIVDGNDTALKKLFTPFVEDELLNQTSFKAVSKTIQEIGEIPNQPYTVQVNPREINLFYLVEGVRERIVKINGEYLVNETEIKFSKEEILDELKKHPERFSPNVMMRPLYEEVVLPNLCYIGGGGEIAYWLELKTYFEQVKVPFPIVLLRNSALLVTEKQTKKLRHLKITYPQLFLKRDSFINRKVREISNIDIDFSPQKKHLQQQFEDMYMLAKATDKSFLSAVKAQEVKQLKGLDALEKRLLKAQKRKLCDEVTRMTDIQNELFPNQSLQERSKNFSEFYLEYGDELIEKLFSALDPLNLKFLIVNV